MRRWRQKDGGQVRFTRVERNIYRWIPAQIGASWCCGRMFRVRHEMRRYAFRTGVLITMRCYGLFRTNHCAHDTRREDNYQRQNEDSAERSHAACDYMLARSKFNPHRPWDRLRAGTRGRGVRPVSRRERSLGRSFLPGRGTGQNALARTLAIPLRVTYASATAARR